MKTALITGGLGFIGSFIARKLVKDNIIDKVVLLDHFGRYVDSTHGEFLDYRKFRTKGIGRDIVKFVLDQIPSEDMIYLHAQESVIKFYKDLGFTIIGSTFIEADIVHAKMVYKTVFR